MRSNFVFQEIWVGLRRNLTMTVALIVVVAISLSLLGTGLLFVKQVDNTRTFWQSKVQLSVYLCTKSDPSLNCAKNGAYSAAEQSTIQTELNNNPDVLSAQFVSATTNYQQFKKEFGIN